MRRSSPDPTQDKPVARALHGAALSVHASMRSAEQMMIRDAQGLSLTGATDATAAQYDRAVRAFNLACGDAVGLLDAAREAAPGFVMAHLAKAWLFILARDSALDIRVDALIVSAA